MCGIAGFSLNPDSSVDRTLAAQALLAGISERGADAVGYAQRSSDGPVSVTKLRGGASALLDELEVPAQTAQALIHVRDFTKGHPEISANNHPIRHGPLLPRNPWLADWLLGRALAHAGAGEPPTLMPLDDALEAEALRVSADRARRRGGKR